MAYHDKVSSLLLKTSPMPKRRGQTFSILQGGAAAGEGKEIQLVSRIKGWFKKKKKVHPVYLFLFICFTVLFFFHSVTHYRRTVLRLLIQVARNQSLTSRRFLFSRRCVTSRERALGESRPPRRGRARQ